MKKGEKKNQPGMEFFDGIYGLDYRAETKENPRPNRNGGVRLQGAEHDRTSRAATSVGS